MFIPMSVLSPDLTSVLVGVVVLLCLLLWKSIQRPPGLPPGPGPALPLLGHLHLMAKDPRAQWFRWRRQYGDVFSLYMGRNPVVVLASYSAIREALVTLADAFSDRPHTFVNDFVTKRTGLIPTSGDHWKEQRRTATRILRDMGMGKNVLADRVQEEITLYIRAIEDHQGAPVDLGPMTQVTIANNICSIALGRRFDYQDQEFIDLIQKVDHKLKLLSGTTLLNFFPLLRHLPGDLFRMKEVLALDKFSMNFVGERVSEHQRILEEQGEKTDRTDFLYGYLHEIQKLKDSGVVDTTINEANLRRVVNELFIAGTETTSSALYWALLFFLHHPHVQDTCFQEISDVIGLHRRPTMQDKASLPYLEATICEVLRKGDIVPMSLPHATSCDVTFRGYVIPKGATVLTALHTVLQDPEIWGDPENFRPERFLGADGKLTQAEELIPFSMGHRVCLGQSLARMELFLYLATLVQHFRFLPAEEGQLPSLEGVFGLTHSPQPYKIRAEPRM